MANIARISFKCLFNNHGTKCLVTSNTFKRTIISKATIPDHLKPAKLKPWNYNEKRYNWFHHLYDNTSSRFNENSVVSNMVKLVTQLFHRYIGYSG